MNILTQKGLGVTFTAKVIQEAVFIEDSPEESSKRQYLLTVKGAKRSYVTRCNGKRELFSRAWTILKVHFPAAYEAAAIRQIAERKAKASRRTKKAAAGGTDVRELINLFRRKGVKKGNGKIVALFL